VPPHLAAPPGRPGRMAMAQLWRCDLKTWGPGDKGQVLMINCGIFDDHMGKLLWR